MAATGVHDKLKLYTTFEGTTVYRNGKKDDALVDKMDEGTHQKDHGINKIDLESQEQKEEQRDAGNRTSECGIQRQGVT